MILAAILAGVFFPTYTIGSPIQEWIEEVPIAGLSNLVRGGLASSPAWLSGLIVDGIIGGVGSVLTFLPILIIFFAVMGILKDTGYMARAALVVQMLFIPCVATVAAIRQESSSWKWTLANLSILLVISLGCGILVYQIAGLFLPTQQREPSMLENLIRLLKDPHTHSLNDLAHSLGTTTEMVEIMLKDLERMGYVRQVTNCDSGCSACQKESACSPAGTARLWEPVQRQA